MVASAWGVVAGPRGVSQALINPAAAARITAAVNAAFQSDQE